MRLQRVCWHAPHKMWCGLEVRIADIDEDEIGVGGLLKADPGVKDLM